MAQIEITDGDLIVQLEGMEHTFLFLWGKEITIPLAHVLSADADPETAERWWHWPKTFGTGVPGMGSFGLYFGTPEPGETGLTLWDVADPKNAIVIRLSHERYKTLVVGVDDPPETVAAINTAIGARSG